MTHDLVERLRDPNYAGCMQHLRSYDEIDRLFNQAADRIECLERENANLRAERDAAFAMSKCECGADEACANLARLRADMAELRKALEPFAKYETADGLPCGLLRAPDRHPILFNGLGDEIKIIATVGDFRRAAAAIRNMGESE